VGVNNPFKEVLREKTVNGKTTVGRKGKQMREIRLTPGNYLERQAQSLSGSQVKKGCRTGQTDNEWNSLQVRSSASQTNCATRGVFNQVLLRKSLTGRA